MANALELIKYQVEECFGEIDFSQLAVSALWNHSLPKRIEKGPNFDTSTE